MFQDYFAKMLKKVVCLAARDIYNPVAHKLFDAIA